MPLKLWTSFLAKLTIRSQGQQSKSFLKASGSIALATLATRLFGLGRDIAVAHFFGASAALDAFFVAFKIPNFLRRLFAEGAFAQGLVPTIGAAERPEALFQSLWTGTIAIGLLLTLIAECFAPFWVHCFAPGFAQEQFQLATELFRITFPFLFFVLLSALFSSVLNLRYRFGLPALAPIWLNLTTIIAAYWGRQYFHIPVTALAWGVTLGGLLQTLFLWALLKPCAWPWVPALKGKFKELMQVFAATLPAIIGISISQMGLVVDVILASYLPAGSISWLFYADRLVSMPVGIIGVAISSAILPFLTHYQQQKEQQAYRKIFDTGLRLVLLLGLPATFGLIILSGPIVATLFHSGRFDNNDVLQATACLRAFAYGLPGIMLIKVFVSTLNARKQFRLPCFWALFALAINAALAWYWLPHYRHVGLALATTVAIWINALGVMCYAVKPLGLRWLWAWRRFLLRLLLALVAMVLWLYRLMPALSWWLSSSYGQRWLHLLVLVFSAIAVFAAVLYLLNLKRSRS